VIVRSGYAHGVINGIDAEEASHMPGVLGIFTGPDLAAANIKNMLLGQAVPTANGSPMHRPSCPVLTSDKVRYVGDPLAIVVAETAARAKDAAEQVFINIDSLPAVTGAKAAAAPGAPQLHDGVPGNVAAEFHYGDAEKVAAAFATAAHVTRLEIPSNRIVVCPMEPRSAIAEYDMESDRWTLRVGCQGVFGLKNGLANVLGVERDKVRVLTGNVGGSFGMKSAVYPEYLALFHAAKALGRPVKWTDERSESFVSDSHGRDHEMTCELALDVDGNFLAVRVSGYGNLGAYVGRGTPIPPTANAVKNTIGVYGTPFLEVATKLVVTNTQPVGAYRGAGRPEGNYYMERLVDTAAAEMGRSRVELRRRNHILAEMMPYKAPNGTSYDSGEFTALLDETLLRADWDGFETRKEESRARGRLRGRGIGRGRAGNRPGADGTHCLRRRGPVPHGVPDRLCAAVRVGRSDVSGPQPSGTSENKSARCQRVWRGRLRRVAAGSSEPVVDALSEYGIRHIDMPATPHKVWQAIRQAQSSGQR
jgi:carbon-monoxide dehydrogenase large subunit